jgi:hypothetical protein
MVLCRNSSVKARDPTMIAKMLPFMAASSHMVCPWSGTFMCQGGCVVAEVVEKAVTAATAAAPARSQ